jgi:hypothetical protein
VQVKRVWLALPPALGPALVQLVAAPLTLQVIEPAGAVAPTIPLTVAVKVRLSPKTGAAGVVVIAIVGVALVTLTLSGVSEDWEE